MDSNEKDGVASDVLRSKLKTLKTALLADREQLFALSNLGYLGFLFVFALFGRMHPYWLPATLLSVPLFLIAYALANRLPNHQKGWAIAAIAGLGFALLPFNPGANTYIMYVAALAASFYPWRVWVPALALVLLAWFVTCEALKFGPATAVMTALLTFSVGTAASVSRAMSQRDAALRLSQEEVRHLAQVAERERIGRDLHDLLGHSLSVIVLKAELANRLQPIRPADAAIEMAEVERISRETLGQVRRAVTGIRAAGLQAELVHARIALKAADIHCQADIPRLSLPTQTETTLALMLREAITNVIRHAGASRVVVAAAIETDQLRLTVADNGRGQPVAAGHGLQGMRERIEGLDGTLALSSSASGTTLVATVPVPGISDTLLALRAQDLPG